MTRSANIPVIIIGCKVFEGLVDKFLPKSFTGDVKFLDYGLHSVPAQLKEAVQAEIDEIETPSLVVLAYGLCGNGLDGLQAGNHTLLVPKADDCIAIFYGSYSKYKEEFEKQPGTYYLTKGWLESGSDPLKEYHQIKEKYGAKADWIMDQQYQHYRRLVFIAHNQTEIEEYRPRALEVAKYCERWGMDYEEVIGSDSIIRRLIEIAVNLEKLDGDFIITPPGGTLKQKDFIH
jgi:hypothetical protein